MFGFALRAVCICVYERLQSLRRPPAESSRAPPSLAMADMDLGSLSQQEEESEESPFQAAPRRPQQAPQPVDMTGQVFGVLSRLLDINNQRAQQRGECLRQMAEEQASATSITNFLQRMAGAEDPHPQQAIAPESHAASSHDAAGSSHGRMVLAQAKGILKAEGRRERQKLKRRAIAAAGASAAIAAPAPAQPAQDQRPIQRATQLKHLEQPRQPPPQAPQQLQIATPPPPPAPRRWSRWSSGEDRAPADDDQTPEPEPVPCREDLEGEGSGPESSKDSAINAGGVSRTPALPLRAPPPPVRDRRPAAAPSPRPAAAPPPPAPVPKAAQAPAKGVGRGVLVPPPTPEERAAWQEAQENSGDSHEEPEPDNRQPEQPRHPPHSQQAQRQQHRNPQKPNEQCSQKRDGGQDKEDRRRNRDQVPEKTRHLEKTSEKTSAKTFKKQEMKKKHEEAAELPEPDRHQRHHDKGPKQPQPKDRSSRALVFCPLGRSRLPQQPKGREDYRDRDHDMPGKNRARRHISPRRFQRGSPSPEVMNASKLVLRPNSRPARRRRRSPSGDGSSIRGASIGSLSGGWGVDTEVGSVADYGGKEDEEKSDT